MIAASTKGLFNRLYKYRQTQEKHQKENFLTEILADLLNRLPRPVARHFLRDNWLPRSAEPRWMAPENYRADWQWVTQAHVAIDGRTQIPDIILIVDRIPTLVVEVKVEAALGKGETTDKNVDHTAEKSDQELERAVDQLQRYEKWLACQQPSDWERGVVLQSCSSFPPLRITESSWSQFGVRQHHCTWRQLCGWFRDWPLDPRATDQPRGKSAWQDLAEELVSFLEEEGMATDYMSQRDIAAAQMYAESADRVFATFDHVAGAVGTEMGSLLVGGAPKFKFHSDGGAIEGWRYLKKPNANWMLVWGIRFPEQSDWWKDLDPPAPTLPHFFLYLQANGGIDPSVESLGRENLLAPWTQVADGEIVATRALHECSDDPKERTNEFAKWAVECAALLKIMLPGLLPSKAA